MPLECQYNAISTLILPNAIQFHTVHVDNDRCALYVYRYMQSNNIQIIVTDHY